MQLLKDALRSRARGQHLNTYFSIDGVVERKKLARRSKSQ